MSWSWEQEDSSHAHWVYIDKDGKVLYDFFSLADEHAEFHDHDDSTDWTGKRVPHPYATDCILAMDVSDEAWNEYTKEY